MKKIIIVVFTLLILGSFLNAGDLYIYIRNTDMDRLLKKVNEKAADGYVVSGGITQAIDSSSWSIESKLFYYVLMYDPKLVAQ